MEELSGKLTSTLVSSSNHLSSLPTEIFDDILGRLSRKTLAQAALVSKTCYLRVVPHLYRSIRLRDRCNRERIAYHDDTPMVKLLLLFIQKPDLASLVRELYYGCYQDLPEPRSEPSAAYMGLETGPPTLCLLQQALYHLTNVHTLRIVHGHQRVVFGLLYGFFSLARRRSPPRVRRLWIESCSIMALPLELFDFGGLQSFRLRRLRLHPSTGLDGDGLLCLVRHADWTVFHASGVVPAAWLNGAIGEPHELDNNRKGPWDPGQREYDLVNAIPGVRGCCRHAVDGEAARGIRGPEPGDSNGAKCSVATLIDTPSLDTMETSVRAMHLMVQTAASTLTSLTLDWVYHGSKMLDMLLDGQAAFPHLNAFQVRNAVMKSARLPLHNDWMLLQTRWRTFLQRHPRIRCLAWPIEHFAWTAKDALPEPIEESLRDLFHNLVELRVDVKTDVDFEQAREEDLTEEEIVARTRRQAFMSLFLIHLKVLEVIKVEGSVRRAEQVQILAALSRCPLRKVVIISTEYPVEDMWAGLDVEETPPLEQHAWPITQPLHWASTTAAETTTAAGTSMATAAANILDEGIVSSHDPQADLSIHDAHSEHSNTSGPTASDPTPAHDTAPGPKPCHLLTAIANHQADTLTELKLCGFRGSPVLHYPNPTSAISLAPLRSLHALQHLVTSLFLPAFYGGPIDSIVLHYWANGVRPPSQPHHISHAFSAPDLSTFPAHALPPPIRSDSADPPTTNVPDGNAHLARVLAEYYHPEQLANLVGRLFGPVLSPTALQSPAGVSVAVFFVLERGDRAEILTFEVGLGEQGRVKWWKGLRSERDWAVRLEKLERRGWF